MADSTQATLKHIDLVQELLAAASLHLTDRGRRHDASKLKPVEKTALDELARLNEEEGPALRGTPEYSRRMSLVKEFADHHYAQNPHHPEHWPNGISDMDLFDLMEMFFDWRAANVERDGGAPMSLSYSIDKYQIEPQLASILANTAKRLGFEVK
jgi:hypothetical protein